MYQFVIKQVCILLLVVLVQACSQRPSDREISQGVTQWLEQGGIVQYKENYTVKKVSVEKVSIQSIGKYDQYRDTWPVVVMIKGTMVVSTDGIQMTEAFDRKENFEFYQQENGGWEVKLADPR